VLVDSRCAYEEPERRQEPIQVTKMRGAKLHTRGLFAPGNVCTDNKAILIRLQSFKRQSRLPGTGNLEGARGELPTWALFNKRNNLSQAKAELEQALNLAKARQQSQTIKTLLQLSSVAFDAGDAARSTEYIQEACNWRRKRNGEPEARG